MSTSNYCAICVNKSAETCSKCKQDNWKTEFIPREDIRKFFHRGYIGNDKHTYTLETQHPELIPTKMIIIGNDSYCPYCVNKGFPIQHHISDYNDYSVTGYCCFCDGAKAELEYMDQKAALLLKHQEELSRLRKEFIPKVKYKTKELFDIWEKQRISSFEFFKPEHSLFTTINDNVPQTIEELLHYVVD